MTADAAEYKAGYDKVSADAAEFKAGFDKAATDAAEYKAEAERRKNMADTALAQMSRMAEDMSQVCVGDAPCASWDQADGLQLLLLKHVNCQNADDAGTTAAVMTVPLTPVALCSQQP